MRRLPGEFEAQSFVQIIFPHAQSDWAPYLDEACENFVHIANAVRRYEQCLIVCDDIQRVKNFFPKQENLCFVQYRSDDTWARDCSGITVYDNDMPKILDFTFTGWGGKFDASADNAMTEAISSHYGAAVEKADFILEGGGIESNGAGTLLTTAECLLNPNRNSAHSETDVENVLKDAFGLKQILWLNHGYLAGDDTDSHIDTLARFIDEKNIMYVQCDDSSDEHYEALRLMEQELLQFRDPDGNPFGLIPLPMCTPAYYDGERLPATYANFLIIDGAVLVPVYNDPNDAAALEIFAEAFPAREIVAIDCSVLIRQHGSLHCVTMQFPKGVLPLHYQ